jgi:hypothetical protein
LVAQADLALNLLTDGGLSGLDPALPLPDFGLDGRDPLSQ